MTINNVLIKVFKLLTSSCLTAFILYNFFTQTFDKNISYFLIIFVMCQMSSLILSSIPTKYLSKKINLIKNNFLLICIYKYIYTVFAITRHYLLFNLSILFGIAIYYFILAILLTNQLTFVGTVYFWLCLIYLGLFMILNIWHTFSLLVYTLKSLYESTLFIKAHLPDLGKIPTAVIVSRINHSFYLRISFHLSFLGIFLVKFIYYVVNLRKIINYLGSQEAADKQAEQLGKEKLKSEVLDIDKRLRELVLIQEGLDIKNSRRQIDFSHYKYFWDNVQKEKKLLENKKKDLEKKLREL